MPTARERAHAFCARFGLRAPILQAPMAGASPAALAAALRALWGDPVRYGAAAAAGRARMGPAGGSAAIAGDILRRVRTR